MVKSSCNEAVESFYHANNSTTNKIYCYYTTELEVVKNIYSLQTTLTPTSGEPPTNSFEESADRVC